MMTRLQIIFVLLSFLISIFYNSYCFGQEIGNLDTTKTNNNYKLEDIIQSFLESRSEDGDFDYNTLVDRLEYLTAHPIDLNNENELDDLILLKPDQISTIKNYINTHGKLISLYELQVIPGMDLETIKSIIPFINLSSNLDVYQVPLSEMIQFGKNQLFLRTGRVLQNQTGYDKTQSSYYLGNPNRLYIRYKHFYENKLSIGITAEKDPGEEFLKGNNKYGFDYYSFHFALKDLNKRIKDLVIGDFSASFGQGLLIHSGFGIGKSPWATNIRKADRSIRPYSSVNESNFLRGIGGNIRLNNQVDATFLLSYRKKDGNIGTDSLDRETLFTSFQESGYHRTNNEIADEKKVSEFMSGVNVKYQSRMGHIALNSLVTLFNKNFTRQNLPYNLYQFNGDRLFQHSIDHSFQYKNFNFFGEIAISNPGSHAIIEGLQLAVDKKLDLSFLYRSLDKRFPALYANTFSENTIANNEQGFYIGAELKPNTSWKIAGYWDMWRHPWLRFNIQAPSFGNEQLLRITYTIRRKLEWYIQYRNKQREENSKSAAVLKTIDYYSKKSLRFNFQYNLSKSLETRSRIELSEFITTEKNIQNGFIIYQDVLYRSLELPISFTSRLAYFNSDSYDSGIYVYENDLLYNFYVPNYYGKGWRYYLNLRYDGFKNLVVEGRYSITRLLGAGGIGSGLDKISGNQKSEIKLQIKWEF